MLWPVIYYTSAMVGRILLVLLVLVALALGEGLTKRQLSEKMMQFNMSPLVSMLVIYDSLKPNSGSLMNFLAGLGQKKKGYFNIITVDCNTDDKGVIKEFVYCQDQYREHLPAIAFSEPSLNNEGPINAQALGGVRHFQGQLDEKSLFNFAVPLMKIYSTELKTSKDMNKFVGTNPTVPKIIYFTDKERKEKIPPVYRALTAHFRRTIAFGHAFAGSQLAKDLNITDFPVFLLNGKQPIELKANLQEMIERLNVIKGEPTKIFIKESVEGEAKFELNSTNIEELVYKAPQYLLIHVKANEDEQHPEWLNLTKKFNKMFKFYESTSLQSELGVKYTPSIVFFPKSVAKKQVQKTIFSTKDTLIDIQKQIDSMAEDFTVPLSDFMEMQRLTGLHLQQQKFVAVFFHEKQIPLSYKFVSNENRFHDEIAFFRMKDPEKQVLQQYQIRKLPALIVMINDKQGEQEEPTEKEKKQGRVKMSLKVAAYQGRYTYADLFDFFKSFSKKVQQEEHDQYKQKVQSQRVAIREVTKKNRLQSICEENCYILLVNGNTENQHNNKNYLSIVEKEAQKTNANFAYIDGACHSEFISSFEIQEDELPSLVFVDRKFQKYSRMVGRLESSSISNFVQRVKSTKAAFRGYDKLSFENKDCLAEHQKIKKLSQSSTMSQQQAEILQQIRAEEEKKRLQLQQAQKQDRVRKRNKKKRPKKQWEDEEL